MKKKDDEEAAKNTIACKLEGERLLLRFDSGEVRLLLPSGDRVFLYQMPSASGVRYTNGSLELRGKGNDLQLARDGTADGADRVRSVRPAGTAQVAPAPAFASGPPSTAAGRRREPRPLFVRAGRGAGNAARRYFPRAAVSMSTYCHTCERIGCGT